MLPFSPAQAYWSQRNALAQCRQRMTDLSRAVGRPSDLPFFQFGQLVAMALDFRPDLILELGRGYGNSTCAFCEAANQIGQGCEVVSICDSEAWEKEVAPRVAKVAPEAWFRPLTIERGDILEFDFGRVLKGKKRVLLFWDAHGYDIAECVLGGILPLLESVDHLVLMHDMSDTRYGSDGALAYGDAPLWRGNNWTGARLKAGARLKLGIIDSDVEQSVSILDFATRNKLSLDSADHSLHERFDAGPEGEEMRRLLGEFFDTQAHWFWFSLNGLGPCTFPKFIAPGARNEGEVWTPLLGKNALFDLKRRGTSLLDLRRRRMCGPTRIVGESPTVVVTPATHWKYALLLPVREAARRVLPPAAGVRIRIDATVETGKIGLGVVMADGQTYIYPEVERGPLEDGALFDATFKGLPENCSLAIRNANRNGTPSRVRIRSIESCVSRASG